ncbi:hypothetical protein J7J47_03470 [Halomonas sp. ISL-60]|uniref:type I restriction enzyme HsdR N-terminal domain-containing protein n=1 Tax=Halomonas sp. ISL-56 TaxID=2819149 RepID=UPI001BEACA6B|nr:type I restriction enzyme HsdR N-terminal domain-containing protein [Halomonas sp. ISL-56]MBT2771289.1 hypothetical protein [Halomonas sp. ISL-60]MBT2800646.1 hypothetical protein [Halomonas sp. ISL-56]
MTLDIRGGLKNTSISSNIYVVVEEMISNAIDSYLIRKSRVKNVPDLLIELNVDFFSVSLLEDDRYDLKISCVDNGAGFGEEQIRAFVTKDSTYKDYLNIQGIGKCKGAGRIQYFHFFKNFEIDSVFEQQGKLKRRTLSTDENVHEITEASFNTEDSVEGFLSTRVSVSSLKKFFYNKGVTYQNVKADFSVDALYRYLYITFMQRFIIIKEISGDFKIKIVTTEGDESEQKEILSEDLPMPISVKTIPLSCSHGREVADSSVDLKITRYSLPYASFKDTEHEVALCANSALVKSITNYYLRNSQDRRRPINDSFELLLVESDFLEDKVNEQRDGFNVSLECSVNNDFDNYFSMQDVVESLEDYVFGILTPADFDREELIASTEIKFGISRSMLEQAKVKVHYSDTEQNIAKRVLRKYQDEIVSETSKIFDLKQELLKLDPRTQDFREKVNNLSWMYTSTIKKMDMANLSQLVVRRTSMLEVLKLAVDSMLICQNDRGGRKENERMIHNVFFPSGKSSEDSIDHDIWILNEEYHYFEHIASDKPLASIPWNENEHLFEGDIDKQLEELFAKNNEDHSLKRPDIAIFNQEGSAIIIEFKAPKVPIQEHISDLAQYARLISAKSNGRIKKIYGYLIGDTMDESRMPLNYTRFPSGLGYFSTDPIVDPVTRIQYGELYSEVLFYKQFIDRAESRLKIYKEKLNISV